MQDALFSHEATPTMHRSRTKLVNPEVHVSDAHLRFFEREKSQIFKYN